MALPRRPCAGHEAQAPHHGPLHGVRVAQIVALAEHAHRHASGADDAALVHFHIGSVFFATARQVCASLGTALMMLLVVSVPASLALAGMGGAEAAVWGYRAAFAQHGARHRNRACAHPIGEQAS